MWRRDPPPDPMALHGLRPLTWRDGLLWRRLGTAAAAAALWISLALWLLSQWYTPGAGTIAAVAALGIAGGLGVMVERDERDLPRWPRRPDTD